MTYLLWHSSQGVPYLLSPTPCPHTYHWRLYTPTPSSPIPEGTLTLPLHTLLVGV